MKNLDKDTQERKPGDDESAGVSKQEISEASQTAGSASRGLLDRLRNMFTVAPHVPSTSMRDGSKDRTRSVLFLIGGSVGAVLLFIGVFSTPPRPTLQETRSQAGPNLGRPPAAARHTS